MSHRFCACAHESHSKVVALPSLRGCGGNRVCAAYCRAQAILALMRDPERLERERQDWAAKRPALGGFANGQLPAFGSDSAPPFPDGANVYVAN